MMPNTTRIVGLNCAVNRSASASDRLPVTRPSMMAVSSVCNGVLHELRGSSIKPKSSRRMPCPTARGSAASGVGARRG